MTTTYRKTWRPDSTQPLPAGQAAFHDLPLAANLASVRAAGAAVPNPISEVGGILDLRPFAPPIDNQYQVSDCVADATCSALEFCQIRNGLAFNKLSRLFLYYNARLQTQDTANDAGTYIRLAFSTLTSLGTCLETTWAYDPTMVFTRPSWQSYREAYPNKVSAFYSINPLLIAATNTIDPSALTTSIKQALQAQHPVVFGMTVDAGYENTGSDGLVAMPLSTRVSTGGHAQVICGYNDNTQRWIVKNSWGLTWGNAGYCYVPYAYLGASSVNDLWVPTLAPGQRA
jgi:C1A family cysteine protease